MVRAHSNFWVSSGLELLLPTGSPESAHRRVLEVPQWYEDDWRYCFLPSCLESAAIRYFTIALRSTRAASIHHSSILEAPQGRSFILTAAESKVVLLLFLLLWIFRQLRGRRSWRAAIRLAVQIDCGHLLCRRLRWRRCSLYLRLLHWRRLLGLGLLLGLE